MSRKQSITILILGGASVTALGILVWAIWPPISPSPINAERSLTGTTSTTNTTSTAAISSSPALPGTKTATAIPNAGGRELAPWEKIDVPTGSPRIVPNVSKAKAYEALQGKMAALTSGGKTPQAKDLDIILAELQQINGSTDVGGVNLTALRNNLARAEEIKRLGSQMQQIADAPGKQDLPKLQRLMAELQQQQAGLVTDIRSTSASK